MNVLFITNDLFPNLNANSDIAYRLGDYLSNHCNCNVSVLGFYSKGTDTDSVIYNNLESMDMAVVSKYFKAISGKRLSKRLMFVCNPATGVFYLLLHINKRLAMHFAYSISIKKAVRKRRFDCIVAFSEPTSALVALTKLRLDIPYISYKLDPWSTNSYALSSKAEEKKEKASDRHAAAIITTDLIYNEYCASAEPEIMKKVSALNFPNIYERNIEIDNSFFSFSSGIHCAFIGNMYEKIRNPAMTIQLFANFATDGIYFHIFGRQFGKCFNEKQLPPNVIFHGSLPVDVAERVTASADILVNIGNTVLNQMPSKILTYISMGKPIINIMKTPECPTLSYTERYPLALNILETETVNNDVVERVRDFCVCNRGKQIPFKEIREEYCTCTPEYVGAQLYKTINTIVYDRSNRK